MVHHKEKGLRPWLSEPWNEPPAEYLEALWNGKSPGELDQIKKKNADEWEHILAPKGSDEWAKSALAKFARSHHWTPSEDTIDCLKHFARAFNERLFLHAEWPFDWAPKPPRLKDMQSRGTLEKVEQATNNLIAALRALDDISLGLIMDDAMVRPLERGWGAVAEVVGI